MSLQTLGAITGAAVLAGGVLVATQVASDGASAPHTLTVGERAKTDTTVDLGEKGDSIGDQLAFQNPVYDARNHKRVGYDLGSCVRTKPGVAYECSWTLRVTGGSLVVEGPFLDAGDSTLAITGGTGKYADASGDMRLHALNAKGTAYRFAYRVR